MFLYDLSQIVVKNTDRKYTYAVSAAFSQIADLYRIGPHKIRQCARDHTGRAKKLYPNLPVSLSQ